MSRNLPWLAELQPEMFAEIDPVLAARARHRGRRLDDDRHRARGDRGARPGDRAHAAAAGRRPASSTRSALPWHWGYGGAVARRRGQRPDRALGRPERRRSRSPRRSPATSARAAARRADRAARRRARRAAGVAPDRDASRRRTPTHVMTEIADRPAGRRAHGLLHRHDGVHRLQGVRGRLQAVERPARRRRRVPQGRLLRPHRRAAAPHLAPRALRRARRRRRRRAADEIPDLIAWARTVDATAGRRRGGGRGVRQLGLHVRRLQALHERRLPRRLPDRRADPHRVRDRRAPARRLQRLRLLHPVVPVRRRRPRPRRRPRRQVHALLRPPRGRPRAGVREGLPDRLDPVRPLRRARRASPRGASPTLHERGVEGAYLYGAGDEPDEQLAGGLGAFFLLTEPPERYGLPAQADSPIQENVVPATLAAIGAGLLAAAGVAAAFLSGRRRGERRARRHDAGDRQPALAGVRRAAPASRSQLHIGEWSDGRWSYLYGDDTAYAAREADPEAVARRPRATRARASCRRSSRGR